MAGHDELVGSIRMMEESCVVGKRQGTTSVLCGGEGAVMDSRDASDHNMETVSPEGPLITIMFAYN